MLNRYICSACVIGMRRILTMPFALILVAALTLSLGLTLLMPVGVTLSYDGMNLRHSDDTKS